MSQPNDQARMEDLPVKPEQAADVKGGGVIVDDRRINFLPELTQRIDPYK